MLRDRRSGYRCSFDSVPGVILAVMVCAAIARSPALAASVTAQASVTQSGSDPVIPVGSDSASSGSSSGSPIGGEARFDHGVAGYLISPLVGDAGFGGISPPIPFRQLWPVSQRQPGSGIRPGPGYIAYHWSHFWASHWQHCYDLAGRHKSKHCLRAGVLYVLWTRHR
jgi:hypothetical protein